VIGKNDMWKFSRGKVVRVESHGHRGRDLQRPKCGLIFN